MQVSLVGINHQTAPITVREKVAISTGRLYDSLSLLRIYIPQGVILSTCNRTEVYTTDKDSHHAQEASLNFFKAHTKMPDTDFLQYFYISKGREVIEHLFRVASGLDSMIIGEYEVLGQVRHALEVAEKAGMVNLPLRHIFQSAVRTGRKVRQETGISKNALSISSVAVDLATRVISDLRRCKILVIGTGEAGRLVVKVAKERGASQIVTVSRTKKRASALAAALGGTSTSLSNLAAELSTADIVVTCSGAPHCTLDRRKVAEAMRKRPGRPLVIVDIAVPRDAELVIKKIENVFLYNIDDLTEISNLNRKQREGEIQEALKIITAEVDKFVSRWRALEVKPVVSALMQKAEDIRSTQLNKTLKKLRPLSAEEQERLETMTKSIVTKILKDPVHYLKVKGDSTEEYIAAINKLFRLNEEK